MAENFTPGETISVVAGTSSVSNTFSLAQSANYPDVLVINAGLNVAFVAFGGAANLTGANATPVLPGDTMVLRKGMGVTSCSAITLQAQRRCISPPGRGVKHGP